jgi:acetyl esterase/lipase
MLPEKRSAQELDLLPRPGGHAILPARHQHPTGDSMKLLTRLLGLAALQLGCVLFIEVKSMAGALLVFGPKLIAVASAPFVAVAGGIAALLGFFRRDRVAMGLGVLGAGLAWFYTSRVTEPHDAFEEAFGPDWFCKIPAARRKSFLDRRWHWRLPSMPEPRWQQDVVFWTVSDDRELLCDLWQPPAGVEPSGLAFIYLHGSGWHFLDKDAGTRPMFRRLAGQGHVVMDVAYRMCPEVGYQEMQGDVKRAIAWMKAHAADTGVDPARIVVGGGSAGGHLALLAAYTPDHPDLKPADVETDTSVCGVISWYGPPDLKATYDYSVAVFGPGGAGHSALDAWAFDIGLKITGSTETMYTLDWMLRGLMGGSPAEKPGDYALASPVTHAGPDCPPTLLLQGGYDLGIRADKVRLLHAILRGAGVPAAYVEFPYTEHGFDLALFGVVGPAGQAALGDMERFLALMAVSL